LELPSKKSIGVKAKQTKLVEEVLRPILLQYGWNLDLMLVQVKAQICDLEVLVSSHHTHFKSSKKREKLMFCYCAATLVQ
jgi:hypothetical protein